MIDEPIHAPVLTKFQVSDAKDAESHAMMDEKWTRRAEASRLFRVQSLSSHWPAGISFGDEMEPRAASPRRLCGVVSQRLKASSCWRHRTGRDQGLTFRR